MFEQTLLQYFRGIRIEICTIIPKGAKSNLMRHRAVSSQLYTSNLDKNGPDALRGFTRHKIQITANANEHGIDVGSWEGDFAVNCERGPGCGCCPHLTPDS